MFTFFLDTLKTNIKGGFLSEMVSEGTLKENISINHIIGASLDCFFLLFSCLELLFSSLRFAFFKSLSFM